VDTEEAAAVAALVAGHHAAGRAAYPDVAVAEAPFAAEVVRRLGEHATRERIARLAGAHLYLAVACAGGDEVAMRHVEDELLGEVDVCAARLRALPAQAADVRAHVRRILFVSEPARAAAMTSYSGTGDLRGYIRVIATRELIRVINKGRREVGVADEMLDALSPVQDPELVYLRDHYRADVDAAMRAALEGLAEQPRAILRYSLIEGWSIDRIGTLYGVHRATAARWVTAAREELGEAIRVEVARRLAISVDDVASIVRLVQSRIDVSLARMLSPSS
jgi:RNA polymerase sigma-70 factor (ECF subfamily)